MSQFLCNEDILNGSLPTHFEFQGRKVYLCSVENFQPQPGDAPLNHDVAYTHAHREHSHMGMLCPWFVHDGCNQSVMFQSHEGFVCHVGIFHFTLIIKSIRTNNELY